MRSSSLAVLVVALASFGAAAPLNGSMKIHHFFVIAQLNR